MAMDNATTATTIASNSNNIFSVSSLFATSYTKSIPTPFLFEGDGNSYIFVESINYSIDNILSSTPSPSSFENASIFDPTLANGMYGNIYDTQYTTALFEGDGNTSKKISNDFIMFSTASISEATSAFPINPDIPHSSSSSSTEDFNNGFVLGYTIGKNS